MSDNFPQTDDSTTNGSTRRALLKTGAVAAGTLAAGIPGDGSATLRSALAASGATTASARQESKLVAGDGDSGDYFGWAVAVDGDTAVVGARDDDPNGSDAGAAYVYTRSGGTWSQQAKLAAGDGDSDDRFGWSVAVDGDTAVVGAPGDDDPNGSDAGAAYVFTRSSGAWSQVTKLTAGDGEADDRFGWVVAVDGDTAAVGAFTDRIQDPQLGKVRASSTYVYTRSGGGWSQETKLVVSDTPNDDDVSSVALDGDTLVVGDRGDRENGGNLSGAAYVFERSGGSWGAPTKLQPDDGDTLDQFGRSVGVDGDTIVVGASGDESPNGGFGGSAYVFEQAGGGWAQTAKLAASDGDEGYQFGWSAGVDGDTVVVTPYGVNKPQGGSVYVFARDGGAWPEQQMLTADDGEFGDFLGRSVAIDGSSVVVGAPRDADPNGDDAGSAYVFNLNERPTAAFTVETDPVVRGEPVTFDASASADPDGTVAAYEWDWDNDGTFEETTTSATTTHTFTDGGDHTVALRVTDDEGATSDPVTATVTVSIRVDIDIDPGNGGGGGRGRGGGNGGGRGDGDGGDGDGGRGNGGGGGDDGRDGNGQNGRGRGSGGDEPTPINPRTRGQLPVAVHGSATFDPVASVDPSTVHFGDPGDVGFDSSGAPEGGTTPTHGGHDEDGSLLCHFHSDETGFEDDDTEGKLVGLTGDGVPLFGTEDVRIVGP